MTEFYSSVVERLMRYSRIDSQSQFYKGKWPTSDKEYDLARELVQEMQELGISNVWLDEKNCVVYGKIPASPECKDVNAVGFIAHMDTSPEAEGACKPWLLKAYQGGDIVLNKEKNIVMKASVYPNLKQYIGQDLVMTDGTTLLGGDDKASISSIMTMAEYYCKHPEEPHGTICLAFTPDEEVNGLAKDLNLERFGAGIAYTVDGDGLGFYNYECFNASEGFLDISGRSVHTGHAKGIMVNAVDIAAEFMNMLPEEEKPQYTEGYEGFFHMLSCDATCESAHLHFLIRDFDEEKFHERETFVWDCVHKLQEKYGSEFISFSINEQYRNLKQIVEKYPFLIKNLKEAIESSGVKARTKAMRGGTDGSSLSFRGLPCPNLSAGYENAHGRFEYVSVQSMEKNVQILIRLCSIYADKTVKKEM